MALPDLFTALDRAHHALRAVDASDTTRPQTAQTLDAVSAAVAAIETVARRHGYVLSEMRRVSTRMAG